jgi:hypothetical protein
MAELKQYIVVNEFGKEINSVMMPAVYAVWATSGFNAIVAFIRDGRPDIGNTMSYNVDWDKFADFCVRLNGCDLLISNGEVIITVVPLVIVKQDRLPF